MISYLLGGGKRWRAYDIVGVRLDESFWNGKLTSVLKVPVSIETYNIYNISIEFLYNLYKICIYILPGGQVRGFWGGRAPPGCSLIYAVNRWLALIYLVLKTERDQRERAGSSATNGRWTQNRKVMDISVD